MTWIKLRLPANKEEQKEIHRNLRKEVQNLVNLGALNSFVMTYHVKETDSSFHLCLEIPELHEYSLNALEETNHMDRVLDIIHPFLTRQKAGVSDYFKETVNGQAKILSQFESITQIRINPEVLAVRLIENASRGCNAALDILDNSISVNLNPIMLYDLIIEKCSPLNGGLWLSDSAHFCFNSLGFNSREEYATRGYPVFPSDIMVQHAMKAIERLLNREGVALVRK